MVHAGGAIGLKLDRTSQKVALFLKIEQLPEKFRKFKPLNNVL